MPRFADGVSRHPPQHPRRVSPTTPVTVQCIMRERDDIRASEVTATGCFCLFVRKYTIHPRARVATTREYLNSITRKPDDAIVAAESPLTDAFHASMVDRDCLHANETMFFWHWIPKDKLKGLMHRLNVMEMPTANESVGQQSVVITPIRQIVEKL